MNDEADLPPGQQISRLQERILADAGVTLARDAAILDFGCGSGRHVYEYLDQGYSDVRGYDVRNAVALRRPEDIDRFGIDPGGAVRRIPFPDDTFDFVYSTSVFEHVLDQEQAWREIWRVLKPGAVSLHNFPARWRPIEPHIFVPLGGAITSPGWYRLWATLGIRNSFQKTWSIPEVTRANMEFAASGMKYTDVGELERMIGAIFGPIAWMELSFLRHSPGRSRHLYPLVKRVPSLALLFRYLHTHIVLLRKAG